MASTNVLLATSTKATKIFRSGEEAINYINTNLNLLPWSVSVVVFVY